MAKQKVYRQCFFTKDKKKRDRLLKDLRENYEVVEVENFAIKTKQEGITSISVVYYHTIKECDLFSNEEWEIISHKINSQSQKLKTKQGE